MSTIASNEKELLARVETLLEQDPTSQDDTLRQLQKELGALRAETDTHTIETVFQSFGTAVGADSMRFSPTFEKRLLIQA
jgi:hypothetical protein